MSTTPRVYDSGVFIIYVYLIHSLLTDVNIWRKTHIPGVVVVKMIWFFAGLETISNEVVAEILEVVEKPGLLAG